MVQSYVVHRQKVRLAEQCDVNIHSLIFQRDGEPDHWHVSIREYLSSVFSHRCGECIGVKDLVLYLWFLSSPYLTLSCGSTLMVCVCDPVYVLPCQLYRKPYMCYSADNRVDYTAKCPE
ncbi:hypothetical protein TNCV_4578881 [Trichonephila clavipes]|nr:hypothetical protein TNCV_4578881 [Trichonephila clavipes]